MLPRSREIESQSVRAIALVLFLSGLVFATGLTGLNPAAVAAEEGQYKTGNGIAAYLGFLPAEMVKGHPQMHGGAGRGPHAYHLVAALFDAASGERISDAKVTAHIAPLGLTGQEKTLERMEIAGTATYGAFLTLPGADLYTVSLKIQRPGARVPVVLEFAYDHRNR